MSDFVKEIHNMFDHIWDCEIDHPVYQDTVGELMEAVIQTYEKHKPTLGTNLAEVGTDCISRQAAIDALKDWYDGMIISSFRGIEKVIDALPPVQPDIIRCRNCKFASGDSRICMKFGHSPIGELDFCAWAERRTDE